MPEYSGFVHTDAGVAVSGAIVNLYDKGTVTPSRANTTTDSSGFWTISHATEGLFDIQITSGSSIRRELYDVNRQVRDIEVANFTIRNPADTFSYDIVPAAITANRTLNLPLITGTATIATIDEGVKGADISSVGAVLTLVAGSDFADVTGTTTITSISTRSAGSVFTFQFDAALILTHNATTLILQDGVNLTTAAGDVVAFISEGSGNWRELSRRLATADHNVVQMVSTETGAVATGTTTIPFDDTIPQNTEGDEYMTLAITPTSTSNNLLIMVTIYLSSGTGSRWLQAALFRDSVAGALASSVTGLMAVADDIVSLTFTKVLTAPSASAQTYKVRAGAHGSGTTTVNGRSAGRIHGGVLLSSIRIFEVKP